MQHIGFFHTCLHFVSNEHDVVLLGDLAEALEKGWGGMVVATLTLNRLYNDCSHRTVPIAQVNASLYKTFEDDLP